MNPRRQTYKQGNSTGEQVTFMHMLQDFNSHNTSNYQQQINQHIRQIKHGNMA